MNSQEGEKIRLEKGIQSGLKFIGHGETGQNSLGPLDESGRRFSSLIGNLMVFFGLVEAKEKRVVIDPELVKRADEKIDYSQIPERYQKNPLNYLGNNALRYI